MLKNIRLHLGHDEQQREIENKLSAKIQSTHLRNTDSVRRNIPNLLPYFQQLNQQNLSIFCNKNGQFNVVDYGLGRTFYGLDPQAEVDQHLAEFCLHAPRVNFDNTKPLSAQRSNPLHPWPQAYLKSMPNQVDALVVFGLGLGQHIESLLANHQIKNLIIYEPEEQLLRCSAMVTNWTAIFNLAKQHNTALFVQVGKDGRELVENMQELQQHTQVSGFYFYQHYNHPVFDKICEQLLTDSWQYIERTGLKIRLSNRPEEYCPSWTPTSQTDDWQLTDKSDALFKRNLTAFKRYFPAIFQEFETYEPTRWLPVRHPSGDINLVDKTRGVSWYGDSPQRESEQNFCGFKDHPHKDGLVLGYNGTKLKHYVHYQFVEKTEAILEKVEEEQGSLPNTVKAIIMFGLGCGYQLPALLDNHDVEKLFICEPNRDFFYASLFAIDWQKVLEEIDQKKYRIYINIGDDGTNLFRDLLNQFYSIGPYILSNTYFYQSYYNSSLNLAISHLREQLQVVISMGEYYDHAFYGISHTIEGILHGHPHLAQKPSQKLSWQSKEVPVFLIGNGPSLDQSIDTIREWADKAILVTCGTSLQVMQRHGIVPDFHAEIEQNRSTFDWACRIGDLDYLKQITLLSCNGIHPDTCQLYRDVLIAFKAGESSTVSTLNVLQESEFETLDYAFPTVSNFAINLFLKLGFSQIYLLGVDLGFVDVKHHHSKLSGYYKKDGEEIYDYSEKNNTSLVVPGNFRKTVHTKHEFKVSRMVIEQALHKTKIECYNCSDGAKIEGTTALQLDSILITSTSVQKQSALTDIKTHGFISIDADEFLNQHQQRYQSKRLKNELNLLRKMIRTCPATPEAASELTEKQKELLFHSYSKNQSLLFYYLYGTINYANAILSRLINTNRKSFDQYFSTFRDDWLDTLKQVQSMASSNERLLDTSFSMRVSRAYAMLDFMISGKSVSVFSNSSAFVELFECELSCRKLLSGLTFKPLEHVYSPTTDISDFVVIFASQEQPGFSQLLAELIQPTGALRWLDQARVLVAFDANVLDTWINQYPRLTFSQFVGDLDPNSDCPSSSMLGNVQRCINYLLETGHISAIIPKIQPKSHRSDFDPMAYLPKNLFDKSTIRGAHRSLFLNSKDTPSRRFDYKGDHLTVIPLDDLATTVLAERVDTEKLRQKWQTTAKELGNYFDQPFTQIKTSRDFADKNDK